MMDMSEKEHTIKLKWKIWTDFNHQISDINMYIICYAFE